MLTKIDFCDYDTCVALREVGCRIQTEWYIHQPSYERGSCYLCPNIPNGTSVLDECDYIPRVSLYEAQKWLREEKSIIIIINIGYSYYSSDLPFYDKPIVKNYYYGIWELDNLNDERGQSKYFDSYEEALSEGVKCAVKILKEE